MKIRFAAVVVSLAVSSALASFAGGARAQVVYRCGNQYTSVPCPEGRVVEATDPRSAAQRAEARRVAAQERQLAAQMKKDRAAAEAAQAPLPVAGFDSRASASPSAAASEPQSGKKRKKKSSAKKADGDDFTAIDPTTVGKKKAR